MRRTRIKICGVTRLEDAELAVELGADFLGLNFFSGSPRFLAVDRALEIAERVRGRIGLVGVFVNSAPHLLEEIDRAVGLDLLQFHGEERVGEIAPFAARAIKVFRLESRPTPDMLEPWRESWGFLFEGRVPDQYGGGGAPWAYEMIASLPKAKPVLLAGGLTPENVGGAIRATGAWGIDVASGVERSPGIKSKELMVNFISEVRGVDGEEE